MFGLQMRTRVIQSLIDDMKKGRINVDHPLQRQSGQWTRKQMCRLIYCLMMDRAMPTILFSKQSDSPVHFVIDGKQRLTVIYSYYNNEFKLNPNLEPIVIDGKEYDVSNKYYKDLDDAVKDRILNKELMTQIMIDPTDRDERESFVDFNSTPSLANTQLRKADESENLMGILEKIKKHPFFSKVFTPKQLLKDVDNEVALQVIMLTEISKDYPLVSFNNAVMSKFVKMYNENINHEKIDLLMKALDVLDDEFKYKLNIKKTTIPMVIYGMYRVVKDKKDTKKYIEWLKDFLANYEKNEEYREYVKDNTSSARSVQGRFQYFRKAIKEL